MLVFVQSELNFSFTLVPSKNGRYGTYDQRNKEWTGQIGMLQKGEIDFSVMDLTVNPERSEVICKTDKVRISTTSHEPICSGLTEIPIVKAEL